MDYKLTKALLGIVAKAFKITGFVTANGFIWLFTIFKRMLLKSVIVFYLHKNYYLDIYFFNHKQS